MKNLILFLLLLVFVSCNEEGPVNSVSDKTVIEKIISPSESYQNIETSEGIRIVVPPGSLMGDLSVKVVKLTNPPISNDKTIKLGPSFFKITFSGELNLKSDIEIRIKYDSTLIQESYTVLNGGVYGLKYHDGIWQKAYCMINPKLEELIFYFNDEVRKIGKNTDQLQSNYDIIIGDGYSTTDTGNQDNKLLGYLKQCKYIYPDADAYVKWSDGESSYIFDGDGSGVNFFPYGVAEHPQVIVWSGNKIDVSAPYFYNEYGLYYHINGEFNNDGSIKEMTFEFSDKYDWSAKLIIRNVPLDYTQYEGWVDFRIPVKNDPDRRKYVIDFRATEPIKNGTRTISTIDWETFNLYLTFKINP